MFKKSKKSRVNFDMEEEFYGKFKKKVKKNGYSTISEFFREKAREVV